VLNAAKNPRPDGQKKKKNQKKQQRTLNAKEKRLPNSDSPGWLPLDPLKRKTTECSLQ